MMGHLYESILFSCSGSHQIGFLASRALMLVSGLFRNILYYALKAEVSTRKELTPAGNKVSIQTAMGVATREGNRGTQVARLSEPHSGAASCRLCHCCTHVLLVSQIMRWYADSGVLHVGFEVPLSEVWWPSAGWFVVAAFRLGGPKLYGCLIWRSVK